MRSFIIFPIIICIVFVTCSKGNDSPNPNGPEPINRELSPLAKKLIGKWWLLNWNPAIGDFWEFKDIIIDSLSNDSVTYRKYTDSVKQSWCGRVGKWYEKDSVLYGTCIPNARIIKLTEDTLIFRYYHYQGGVTIDYKWKRAR